MRYGPIPVDLFEDADVDLGIIKDEDTRVFVIAAFIDNVSVLGTATVAPVVVIDNGGGAIFSHLPQRRLVDPATFTRLFTTPQRLDLARLACGVSDEVVEWSSWVDVDFDWLLGGGVRVAVARCEPWRKHAEPGPGIAEPDSGLLPQKGYGRTSAASIA